MTAARTWLSRLLASAGRSRRSAALNEEIECHLEMLADEFRAQGLSEQAARARARRAFGNVGRVKEATQDAHGFPFVESLVQDIRFALRQLRRTKSFTVAAVLTLAIGIGGTVGIFSVLDVVAFRSLSYPQPDRLVTIQEGFPRFGPFPASAADAEFWSAHTTSFEQIALVTPAFMNLTGSGEPERLQVGRVSSSLLPMLGATTQAGRLFLDSEDRPGADQVVVLSDGIWRRRFGGDPAIVGKTIALDGVPHEVIGVLAAGFRAPNVRLLYSIPVPDMVLQAWKPIALTPQERPAVGGYNYPAVARLKAGVPIERARQDIAAAQAALLRSVPGKSDLYAVVVPLQEQMASRARPTLMLLFAATGIVLLIGCVNTTNLLSGRMLARRREIAVRAAIGAGRWRLARQVLVENLVLAAGGAAAGVVVAAVVIRIVVMLAPSDVPRLDEVALDSRALLFAVAVAAGCGVLIGAPSAWRLAAGNLQSWLAQRADGAVAPGSYSVLVVGEIALCAASVGVALLLGQSFLGLSGVDKGFDAGRILTAGLNLSGERYEAVDRQEALFEGVTGDIRALPGVTGVAVSTQLPLTGTGALSALSVEGTTAPPVERPSADVRSVTPDYFDVMRVPLVSGRLPTAHDRARPVAVLSAQLAAQAWPSGNPLGRRFQFGLNPTATVYEVIGVVGDVRGTGLDQPLTPTAYVPFPQRMRGLATLLVKADRDPSGLAAVIRQVLRARDHELPLPAFRTMEDVVSGSLDARRFQLSVVAVFAGLAVLLAGIGVYGVMSYSVVQRRAELGVRLALGAAPVGVLLLVIRRAAQLGLAGLVLALPLAWLGGSTLRSFLFGVTPFEPRVMILTAGVTFCVAVAAAAVPAFRASRLEPVTALRHE
ncbi:MAG TPA: ABC transporter permease [Vicinamibacterales bacterium]|nr:ABC transporter permease [Vicinamibacterales bacterium]